jgi:hypothetical protein
MPIKYKVKRDIKKSECLLCDSDIKKGTILYAFDGDTEFFITDEGLAVTFNKNGNYPYFEIPRDSVEFFGE